MSEESPRVKILRESTEKRYEDIELVLDRNGSIININESGISKLGYELRDVLGEKFSERMLPLSEKDQIEDFLERIDEEAIGVSASILHANGRSKSYLIIGLKLKENPEMFRLVCIPELDRETDVTEPERSFFEIKMRNEILEVFLSEKDDEVFAEVLDIVLKSTRSKFGYFGYIDENGALVCPSMTRDIWDKCQVPDKDIIFQPESWGGIWKESLVEKRVVVKNVENTVPEGHIHITRSVAVPIIFHKKVIGQITVANKPSNYSEYDVHLMKKFADMIAPILHARLEIERGRDALETSESHLKLIAENAQDLIYRIRMIPELKFEYISPSATEMIGYSPQDHYDNPSLGSQIIHPEDKDKLQEMMHEVSSEPIIMRWVHKNGEIIWIEQNNTPIYDNDGNLIALEGIARDITKRKAAEDEIIQKKLLSDKLYDTANSILEYSDFADITTVIIEACKSITGATTGNIMIITDEEKQHEIDLMSSEDSIFIRNIDTYLSIKGLSEKVYRSREPLYENDLTHPEFYQTLPEHLVELENILCVPIVLEERTQGLIALSNKSEGFSNDDLEYVSAFANLAAIALQRIRTLETLEETNRSLERKSSEMQMLYSLSQEVGQTVSYEEVMPILHRHLNRSFNHDVSASLFIIEEQQYFMINPIRPISSKTELQIKQMLREGYLKLRAESTSELPEDPIVHVRTESPIEEKGHQLVEIQSTIKNPIVFPDTREVIGLVLLGSEKDNQFTEDDIRLLFTSMNQVSLVLQKISVLRSAEKERLASLIEHLPEGVLLINPDERILFQNKIAETYLDMVGIIDSDNSLLGIGNKALDDILNNYQENRAVEIQIQDPPRIFEVMTIPIQTGPQKGGWVLVIEDVTIMREIQERVSTQERLASVGQLAAGMAHDFSNILQGIIGFTELLQLKKIIPDDVMKDLKSIQSLANKGAELTHQILDFSKQSISEKKIVDLRKVIDEILSLLKTTIPSNIRLLTEYEVGNYTVMADPTQLHQVLMNLAINSRDVMPDGGIIKIKLSTSRNNPDDTESSSEEWIRLEVIDNGPGIEDSIVPHIFEPFFTTKDRAQGSGLGLAQVYGIIDIHNGTISVETELDSGTTFVIHLPMHHEVPVEQEKETKPDTDCSGISVLLVDDDEIVLEAISRMLERLGCQIYTASNGIMALEIYHKEKDNIDIIMTDMMMPDMDGIELAKKMASINPSVRMILMTGYPLGSKKDELQAIGLVTWVQKPVRMARIGELIKIHSIN
ncbi:MAG: putative Histidine kinase [Candidatus Thorarchaeota archaeon]|nr:MAG: putative Histidine kinase [Candidatus Thorarchaeota archaeon]